MDDIKHSFRRYLALIPDSGAAVVNLDDENVRDVIAHSDRPLVTYSVQDTADFWAESISMVRGYPSFTVCHRNQRQTLSLKTPGIFSVYNALAAIAVSCCAGIDFNTAVSGAALFTGIGRRFETKGHFNGALIVDDFAHHPTEMTNTLSSAMQMGYQRVLCAFQSHTYSRTAALFDGFVRALQIPDRAYVLETYAARESNTTGITAQQLADAAHVPYFSNMDSLADALRKELQPGDLLLTMGAGNISQLFDILSLAK